MNKPVKIISACAACAAAVGLGIYAVVISKDKKAVPIYSDVVETTATVEATTKELPDDLAEKYGYVPSQLGMTDRAKSLVHVNKDVVGWIKVDGLQIDYPIVMDPGDISSDIAFCGGKDYDSNSFYLDNDLYRQYDERGSLFLDYRDTFGAVESEQSENQVIYGHAWWNGEMLGCTREYRLNPDFYWKNPFIHVSSNYKDYDYVIFAVLVTSGTYDATDFRYWTMEDLSSEEDFNFYIDKCKSRWLYDTGVDVKYGDKLITLSTCYSDVDNSRFLVVGRRLRDGEVAGDTNSIKRTESWLQAQKAKEAEKAAEEQAQQ